MCGLCEGVVVVTAPGTRPEATLDTARALMRLADSGKGWLHDVGGVETLVIGVTDASYIVGEIVAAVRAATLDEVGHKVASCCEDDFQRTLRALRDQEAPK